MGCNRFLGFCFVFFKNLFLFQIDKQFGYFPKDAVREEHVHATMEVVVSTQVDKISFAAECKYVVNRYYMRNGDVLNLHHGNSSHFLSSFRSQIFSALMSLDVSLTPVIRTVLAVIRKSITRIERPQRVFRSLLLQTQLSLLLRHKRNHTTYKVGLLMVAGWVPQ